jgi:hypothetical protein
VSKKKKSSRRVVPTNELPPEPLVRTLREGTDLACALVCGAYIENGTGALLQAALINDFDLVGGENGLLNSPTGILTAASARATMCYAMALIDNTTYKNAKQIGRIRNTFAHSHVPISFGNEDVKSLCGGLDVLLMNFDEKPQRLDPATEKRILDEPRLKFVFTACITFLAIQAATLTEHFRTDGGEVMPRIRQHPVHPEGRFAARTDGKSFGPVVLFDT